MDVIEVPLAVVEAGPFGSWLMRKRRGEFEYRLVLDDELRAPLLASYHAERVIDRALERVRVRVPGDSL